MNSAVKKSVIGFVKAFHTLYCLLFSRFHAILRRIVFSFTIQLTLFHKAKLYFSGKIALEYYKYGDTMWKKKMPKWNVPLEF